MVKIISKGGGSAWQELLLVYPFAPSLVRGAVTASAPLQVIVVHVTKICPMDVSKKDVTIFCGRTEREAFSFSYW